jgi:Tol biopolymer transport system component
VLGREGKRPRVIWESGRGEEYRRIERIQWARDGRRLIFNEVRGPFGSDDLGYAIRLVTPGAGAERVLARLNPAAWDWSSDGRWLAFKALQGSVRDAGAPPGLWIARLDGGALRRLVPTREDSSWIDFPAWSPDGEKIAYFFGKHGPPSFLSLSAVDRRGRVTTLWRQRDAGFTQFVAPAWSPDGSRVYAAVDETLIDGQPAEPGSAATRSAAGTIAAIAPAAGVFALFAGGDLRLSELAGGAATSLTRGGAFSNMLEGPKLGAWEGERDFAPEVAITPGRRVAVTAGRGLYRFGE